MKTGNLYWYRQSLLIGRMASSQLECFHSRQHCMPSSPARSPQQAHMKLLLCVGGSIKNIHHMYPPYMIYSVNSVQACWKHDIRFFFSPLKREELHFTSRFWRNHMNNNCSILRLQKTEEKKGLRAMISSKMTWNSIYNFPPENERRITDSNQNEYDTYQDLISTITNQRVAQGHTFRNQRWSIEFCYCFIRAKWKKNPTKPVLYHRVPSSLWWCYCDWHHFKTSDLINQVYK